MKAMIFPGQGSQKSGMGQGLREQSAAAREVFARISEAVGQDLEAVCGLPDDALRATQHAQIALYTVSVAAHAAFGEELGPFAFSAGHSVGEYAALAAAEFISIETGARLVARRGALMASAGESAPGTMAAVLGLDAHQIEPVLADTPGVVVVANDNCPGQIVISGDVAAVAAATPRLTEAGAKRVLPLNVSGAFHSPLMEPSSRAMREALDAAEFRPAPIPVVANVTANPVTDPSAWPDLLARQLYSSVRWTESVQRMIAAGVTEFVEFGSGEVLAGLIKRISRDVSVQSRG
ncbi:MAG: ACP S-malonyltransferase [Fimbriimonadaceae bacterium]|nr:ACP S-malonyltransferase [Fimbriimonadaceae bacterium]